MSKTPYEIRLELLKLAQDITTQHYYANRENLMTNWQTEVETARQNNETPPPIPAVGDFPTEQTVLQKAQFLSEFVNKK